jgi:CBS domain-containing protein
MAQTVGDIMTTDLVTLPATATAVEAARAMRTSDIGDVIVLEDSRMLGIVTDRDIVVRTVAEGREPASTPIGEICSRELTTVSPNTDVNDAVALMRERALRRLPVVKDGRPVGIVSLGDLAVERDRRSALGEISAAPPNR